MVIDAHNHPDWHGHDLDRHLENMDRNGIDKCWILSWECPDDEYDPAAYNKAMLRLDKHGPIPFARCLSYAERARDRFVLGYAPDPRRPDAIDSLQAAVAIHGVQVYGELKLRMMFDNLDAMRMYRYCGEAGLPVTVHIDYEFASGGSYPRPNYWYGGGIEPYERAVDGCPETIFIGHAPGFWGHWSADDRPDVDIYPTGSVEPGGKVVEMMRTYPNLWCDLSAGSAKRAMQRDTEYTVQFLLEFQDRILYGRDDFDNDQQELLRGLGLPDDVLTKILSGNALKLAPL